MISAERETAILQHLSEYGVGTTEELAVKTTCSVATIRRDLQRLADAGKLERTHGGARLKETNTIASVATNIVENIPLLQEKTAIAREAAKSVHEEQTVFLGAGQTCAILAREISTIPNLRIVTTSVTAVLELVGAADRSILLLGGDINVGASHIETLDEGTVDAIDKYHFDHAFITVDGIESTFGYSINSRRQLPLYEHLRCNSENFVVLADNAKFGRRAFTRLASLGDVRHVVVDHGVPGSYVKDMKKVGTEVTIADA